MYKVIIIHSNLWIIIIHSNIWIIIAFFQVQFNFITFCNRIVDTKILWQELVLEIVPFFFVFVNSDS